MKQHYLRMTLLSLIMGMTSMVMAIGYPKYPTQTPVEGGKYVWCNLAVPTGYMTHTSWDGALYFLGPDDSNYAEHAFTAHQDEDGRWFFVTRETEQTVEGEDGNPVVLPVLFYAGVPQGIGTNNIRDNIEEPAYFELLPGTCEGFYHIKALEGNDAPTQGLMMHLNAGGQYFIFNEPTNSWYPDFYGGVKYEDDGVTPIYIYDEEKDLTLQVMADSTSTNWAFVHVEDVPTFVLLGNAYSFMGNYEKNYCAIEGYAAGFTATLNAALPLYNAIASQEDLDALKAMVQAKVDLYSQILKAEDLDATALASAIATAKSAFETLTATEAVNEALAALTKACNDYSLGLGDITSMGQNMSFEDLSAQNGSETSSVQPAPKGWTVYVNGEQMAAGSTNLVGTFNWHGVNSDCTGYKDGNVGFGIWAATIPEYEISQTITGLDNGTYTITAGLMLDYRRTTQRIFGNLNSTLYGYEDGYAEGILPAEYKTYAEQTECSDERTMAPVSVRAYVYDGTLTFGVKTNGDRLAALRENGAGGDGWFKVDNFTITKDGFIAQDQTNLYDYLRATLEDLANQPMDANYKEQFSVSYDGDPDAGIAAYAALIPEAQAQAEAYKPLAAALEKAYENASSCEEAGYTGTDDFLEFIDEVKGKYEEGAYTAEDIAAAIVSLEDAYQTCLRSGVDEGADVSDLIVNRSFENQSSQNGKNSDGVANPPYGWELRINGVLCESSADIQAQGINGWCAINSGDNINIEEDGVIYNHQYTDGTHLWGIWNSSIPQIELSQTITGLKPGTYQLTADVMARNTDWSGDNLTTQRIFANSAICLYGMEDYDYWPENLQGTTSDDIYQTWNLTVNEGQFLDEDEAYTFINYGGYDASYNDLLLRTLVLHFGVGEDGIAHIGFRTDNLDGTTGEAQSETAAGWFKVDNFTLFYESSKIPTGINDLTAIQTPVADNATYDLSGRRVTKATKGVYIRNGKKLIK